MSPSAVDLIHDEVAKAGQSIVKDVPPDHVKEIVEALGRVLFMTEVTVRANSKALVTSDRALDYHTDHQRADLICWHCIEQTSQGGETLVLDAYSLLERLDRDQLQELRELKLHEHRVFENDPECFPFLSERFSRPKIYYSFWMLKGDAKAAAREAFTSFRKLTEKATPTRYVLEPGDLLVIDNGRMLHGRTAIEGTKRRMLKRFWIETQTSTLTKTNGNP
jgi:alpha-ketoglutarate-dependent taurine dioxygenase